MTKKTSLEKRIKRRVTARTHRFFAVCSPGLKQLCHKEMVALTQHTESSASTGKEHKEDDMVNMPHDLFFSPVFEDMMTIPGGIEFTGTVQDCYAANLYLRSPSRILMRIAKFKAENFRTFEKRFGEIEWELYLNPSVQVRYEVSTSTSRLYHSDAIAQRAEQVIESHFKLPDSASFRSNHKEKSNGVQIIMIRGENDFFEISIDSSGTLLHKRGVKIHVGAAPLRETIAFAILSAMGYSSGRPLIDGMCGSGTFALEAAMISCNIPAGFYREFAFENWPCFSAAQWNHMKKIASKSFTHNHPIFAVDRDSAVLKRLKETADNFNLSSSINIIKSDFFDLLPEELINSHIEGLSKRGENDENSYKTEVVCSGKRQSKGNKGFVVLNPPYGNRVGDKNNIDQLFADIGKKLGSDFRGWCAAVIIPDKKLLNHLPGKHSLIPVFHGGLDIHAAIMHL